VYLSTYGEDFEGGMFEFHDDEKILGVKPRKGSLLTFSSGIENAHLVNQVTKGERIAWSLWFTCDKSKRFVNSRLKMATPDEL
jgi:predicted 2-oxoglutarate/Fe(II)-dependent dioxygenase YbiX